MKKLAGNRRDYAARILVLAFADVIVCSIALADPSPVPVDWQLIYVGYGVQEWGPGFGGPNYGDYSSTLGADASISFSPLGGMTLGTGSAVAGDNGERSLKAYAGTTYAGGVGGGSMKSLVSAWGQQNWSFSLDHAASLELSYSVDGSLLMSGLYGSGALSVDLQVLRSFWWTVEGIATYHLQINQSQLISEHGTFVLNYDPSWYYELGMYMGASACVAANGLIPSVQSTAVTNLSDFSISLAEVGASVVPVPGAVLLGILGLGVAGLKLRKHV